LESDRSSTVLQGTVVLLLLVLVSVLNATYLFTRINYYHLFNKSEPVNSPGAEFIDRDDLDREQVEPPPVIARCWSSVVHAFWKFW
jgi:hypothetical protein